MNEQSEFRDLAPLSPRLDGERWARMTAAIERAAAPELERRRAIAAPGIAWLISEWFRPALSGAIAVASAASLFLALGDPGSATPQLNPGVSDDLGFSEPVAAWIEADVQPSVEELLLSMETGY